MNRGSMLRLCCVTFAGTSRDQRVRDKEAQCRLVNGPRVSAGGLSPAAAIRAVS